MNFLNVAQLNVKFLCLAHFVGSLYIVNLRLESNWSPFLTQQWRPAKVEVLDTPVFCLNNAETYVINIIMQDLYFGLNWRNVSVTIFTEIDQSQTGNSRSFKHSMAIFSERCCGVDIWVDSSTLKIRNEQILSWIVWEKFSLLEFERNKLI